MLEHQQGACHVQDVWHSHVLLLAARIHPHTEQCAQVALPCRSIFAHEHRLHQWSCLLPYGPQLAPLSVMHHPLGLKLTSVKLHQGRPPDWLSVIGFGAVMHPLGLKGCVKKLARWPFAGLQAVCWPAGHLLACWPFVGLLAICWPAGHFLACWPFAGLLAICCQRHKPAVPGPWDARSPARNSCQPRCTSALWPAGCHGAGIARGHTLRREVYVQGPVPCQQNLCLAWPAEVQPHSHTSQPVWPNIHTHVHPHALPTYGATAQPAAVPHTPAKG